MSRSEPAGDGHPVHDVLPQRPFVVPENSVNERLQRLEQLAQLVVIALPTLAAPRTRRGRLVVRFLKWVSR